MLALRLKLSGYWVLAGVIMAVFLAGYGLAEMLHVPFLSGTPNLLSADFPVALIVIGLLVADTLLPVPSSLVMVASGAILGFWAGAIVSLVGNMAGFVFAYWLGYKSSPLIRRSIPRSEMERGNRVLQKWGVMALILTRPLPILAETTAIMAGIAGLSFSRSLAAVAAGALPISVLYAWAGSRASGVNATGLIFLLLILLAAIAWKVDRGAWPKKLALTLRLRVMARAKRTVRD